MVEGLGPIRLSRSCTALVHKARHKARTMRTVFHSPFNRSLQPHHAHSACPSPTPAVRASVRFKSGVPI